MTTEQITDLQQKLITANSDLMIARERVARLEEALVEARAWIPTLSDKSPRELGSKKETFGAALIQINAALTTSDPAWLEGKIVDAKREALLKMADQCNARAFHTQAPMERAYLEIERECRAEAAAARPEGTDANPR